jgi:predicted nuclease with TOPRIM domain
MAQRDLTNKQLLDLLVAKFDGLENRLDNLEKRFDGLEKRFDGLENRFDSLETRFDALEHRFDSFEEMLTGVKTVVIGIADNMVTGHELTQFTEDIREDFDNLELRLGRRIDIALSRKAAH